MSECRVPFCKRPIANEWSEGHCATHRDKLQRFGTLYEPWQQPSLQERASWIQPVLKWINTKKLGAKNQWVEVTMKRIQGVMDQQGSGVRLIHPSQWAAYRLTIAERVRQVFAGLKAQKCSVQVLAAVVIGIELMYRRWSGETDGVFLTERTKRVIHTQVGRAVMWLVRRKQPVDFRVNPKTGRTESIKVKVRMTRRSSVMLALGKILCNAVDHVTSGDVAAALTAYREVILVKRNGRKYPHLLPKGRLFKRDVIVPARLLPTPAQKAHREWLKAWHAVKAIEKARKQREAEDAIKLAKWKQEHRAYEEAVAAQKALVTDEWGSFRLPPNRPGYRGNR